MVFLQFRGIYGRPNKVHRYVNRYFKVHKGRASVIGNIILLF